MPRLKSKLHPAESISNFLLRKMRDTEDYFLKLYSDQRWTEKPSFPLMACLFMPWAAVPLGPPPCLQGGHMQRN